MNVEQEKLDTLRRNGKPPRGEKEPRVRPDGSLREKLTPEEIREALALEDEAAKVKEVRRPGRRPRLTSGQ